MRLHDQFYCSAYLPSSLFSELTKRQGELVGVVGSVGSGKSAFLSALLGDMYKDR